MLNRGGKTMSTDRALLLGKLAEYGRNGKFSVLEDIYKNLPDVGTGDKSYKIPLETSRSVLNQFIRVLRNSNHSQRKTCVWQVLSFMCERRHNTTASEVLTELESTDIFGFLIASITGFNTGKQVEAIACLSFVSSFGKTGERRQVILGRTEGLIETVLQLIDTKFELLVNVGLEIIIDLERCALLKALFAMIHSEDALSCELFIRKDGFRICNKVLNDVYQAKFGRAALSTEDIDINLLNHFLGVMMVMFNACCWVDVSTTPRHMYSYDPAGLIRTTSALHNIFSLTKDPVFVGMVSGTIDHFLFFIQVVHPESLEFVLLYRGRKLSSTTYSGVPMIIHVVLISRDPQFQHYAETTQNVLLRYTNKFPSVDKMLTDMLSTVPPVLPASGPVHIVCALPRCTASSVGGNCCMKRCSRCRAVYYCGEDCQKEHWKEHKQTCVPRK